MYCSKNCQRQDWASHKIECQTVVPTPFDINNKVARKLICATCEENLDEVLECIGCRSIQYCSSKCQKKHWKKGHKDECSKRGLYIFEKALKASDNYNISVFYKYGTGVAMDLKKCFEYLMKGSLQGEPKAMNNLGMAFFEGEGTEQNSDEALIWLRAAALSGNVTGYHNLGVVYKDIAEKMLIHAIDSEMCSFYFDEIDSNLRRSFESFKIAAEMGYKESFEPLASRYRRGVGCETNEERALFWESQVV